MLPAPTPTTHDEGLSVNPFNITVNPLPEDGFLMTDDLALSIQPSSNPGGGIDVKAQVPGDTHDPVSDMVEYDEDRTAIHILDPYTDRGIALALSPEGLPCGWFPITAVRTDDLHDADTFPQHWAAATASPPPTP